MKLKIKLKIHDSKCDFRQNKFGNMWNLSVHGDVIMDAPTKDGIISNVKTYLGISMTLPKWYRAEIKARSSLYKNYGCILANAVGEVEYDFSKPWFANLIKLTGECKYKHINHGDRIVQMRILIKENAPWYWKVLDLFVRGFKFEEVDVITTTRDGEGSTGI